MDNITSPALLLDKDICHNNIQRMVEKAKKQDLRLKPHMKTHQSSDIGRWFKEAGIYAATVSSVRMAEYFAENGWKDITIAFPCNIREAERIDRLANRIHLSLIINDSDIASKLNSRLTAPVNVYIEIDTGSGRTGFRIDQMEKIEQQVETIEAQTHLIFTGFYSHPGHSYASRTEKEIWDVHDDVLEKMKKVKTHFESLDKAVTCCIGDTPCCSRGKKFDGIDEISPGNFVFYDLTQVYIGSCDFKDIAVAMACPVVEKFPERLQVAVHGGAVHFSKDRLEINGKTHFGTAVLLDNGKWSAPLSGCNLTSISQEHGILSCSKELFNQLAPGNLVGILPVHSCLTADLMSGYITLDGNYLSHMRTEFHTD